MTLTVAPILFRWVHVASACILVGSVFFFDIVLKRALSGLDGETREVVALRCRRGFKMTVHVTLLFLLLTGIVNAVKNWPIYTQNPAVMHGIFGLHALLALAGLALLMIMLAGRETKHSRAGWSRWALIFVLLAVAAAAALKSAREWTITHPNAASVHS